MVTTEIDDDCILRFTLAFVYYVIENCMRPGAIENWVVIIDCNDVGVTEIPKHKIQTMVSMLQKNFRGRLFKLYGINVPFLLRAFWMVINAM
mmetsp:Transcript_40692/g.46643  ORF Transcript_40692/g.46643 Transcript_40692/m.46643 type:complete len:92 (+) Transcript_40692:483-758(+)